MKKIISVGLITLFGMSSYLLADKKFDETELGLRKAPLNDENKVQLQNFIFGTGSAGESQKIERAYENAPPMIPHDIEGMTPITQEDNACLGCHSPEIAESIGATPLPKSHTYDLRNHKEITEGIAEQRYNCTQCHVPQAQTKPLVENNFKPDFRDEDKKHRSNLLDVINQGVQ
ncbi:nitrate reductase cytochrome c-type subunit [Helicobacter sp. faydin-H20]|uniref:nitrate reductase cytochrome c-type subunit n=1 Tax=Helicobacter anatolicus TaxID=2905874 RepID=UPI001E4FAD68|nr:nitrate reductase cytochrome c-type subunit [Helicobacter anatolicus]MCE3036996.1 nitrate reductase cytochrome c-type subunit [Helicobacter anatolicus]